MRSAICWFGDGVGGLCARRCPTRGLAVSGKSADVFDRRGGIGVAAHVVAGDSDGISEKAAAVWMSPMQPHPVTAAPLRLCAGKAIRHSRAVSTAGAPSSCGRC
jgi:hypothetical protein